MNLFYKIHLQAFNVISIVPDHSGPPFGQVLYSCQDAFVTDASDYSGHLIRHLLNASEAFPTEWFLHFWEQVKGWWAHVRTVRWVGKHLSSILFQNFRYCTWGMRPRVNVWSLVTERDLTPVSFFFHYKDPFCRTGSTEPGNMHTVFFTEVWLTTFAKIRKIASSYWPRKRSVQDFWNDIRTVSSSICVAAVVIRACSHYEVWELGCFNAIWQVDGHRSLGWKGRLESPENWCTRMHSVGKLQSGLSWWLAAVLLIERLLYKVL